MTTAYEKQTYHFVKVVIQHIQNTKTLDKIEEKNPKIEQLRYEDEEKSAIRKFNINRLKPTIPDYGNNLPEHHPVKLAKTYLPKDHEVWGKYVDILCVL